MAPNGAATVELLKVLLRMTSERHGVAAKVIATVDDLDRIAGDDEADVPALKGWRRELFGERALDSSTAAWRWRSSGAAWSPWSAISFRTGFQTARRRCCAGSR